MSCKRKNSFYLDEGVVSDCYDKEGIWALSLLKWLKAFDCTNYIGRVRI